MKKGYGKKLTTTVMSAVLAAGMLQGAGTLVNVQAAEASKAPAFQYAENGGGNYTDAYQNIAFTKDGGFVVSGYTFGDSTFPAWTYESDASAPSGKHTNNDAVLIKYDKDHKIEWSKAYGGTGVDVFEAMTVLTDGRIAVAGRQAFESADKKIKGVSWNILVIDPKDPNSYEVYRIGGTSGDQAYGIAATKDGGFVVGGWSASKQGFFTCSKDGGKTYQDTVQLWEAANGTDESLPNRLASGGSDSVVVKVNAQGSVDFCAIHNYEVTEDAYNISNPGERLEALTLDQDDNIILTGYGSVAKNVQNAVIAKLNGKDGSLIWHRSAGRKDMKTVPSDKADYIKAEYMDVTVLTDGSVVAVGTATNDATTEEGWRSVAAKDTIVVHYAADGSLAAANSFGRADDNNSRPEGVEAAPDGGYIVYGSQSGILYEDDQIKAGYDWGNYGAQDAILVKYSANDTVEWSENYGTTAGDWINGLAAGEDGTLIAVGESNGKYGNPSYGNHGGIDGILMISDGTQTVVSEDTGIVKDGNVVWADGTWQGIGNGYGGEMTIEVKVKDHKITSVESVDDGETDAYYYSASRLYQQMIDGQTAGLDTVSGATLSSNGILEGAANALSLAAASTVDDLIGQIAAASDEASKKKAAEKAADAYAQLGSYAIDALQKENILKEACEANGITLVKKGDAVKITETSPALAENLKVNDTYYKVQEEYYRNIEETALAESGYTGKGVRIAVIDSGLTASHKDLDYTHILPGYDYDDDHAFGTEEYPFTDNNGHGTAVTGILQAVRSNEIGIAGLLSETEIIPLKVTPVNKANKEAESIASSEQVAKAIRDAVDTYQADVITTSLDVKDTDALKEAVAYAASKNVIITGASGNSSTAESDGNDAYLYPAAYDEVIGVGAVDKNNRVRVNSQKNDQVFVSAPGENIATLDVSRNTRCKIVSGTSYASPVVAALAVAAKQKKADVTVEEFKELLKESVTDAGAEGYDTSYGHGIVNCTAFVKALENGYAFQSHTEVAKEAAETKAELEVANEELAQAKETLKEKEEALTAAQNDLEKANKQLKDQEKATSEKQKALEVSENAQKDAEAEFKNAQEETKAAQEALKKAEEKQKAAQEAKEKAQAEQKAAQTALKKAEAKQKAAEKAQKKAEKQNKALQASLKKLQAVKNGDTKVVGGQTYKVTKAAAKKAAGAVTFVKAKNAKKVTVPKTVKLSDGNIYQVTVVAKKAFTGKKIRTVVIGANVKTIQKNAFAKSKASTLILQTKKLTAKTVKGSLKGSKVKRITVKAGNKKTNKQYVKKYKKIFVKKTAGKKVTVK